VGRKAVEQKLGESSLENKKEEVKVMNKKI